MKQLLKWLLLSCLVVVLLVVGGTAWLIGTETGLQTSWSIAKNFLPETLSVREVHGKISNKISFTDIVYRDESANEFSIDELSLSLLSASWFDRKVVIKQLKIGDVNISLSKQQDKEKESTATTIELWSPVQVYLQQLSIKSIVLLEQDKADQVVIADLTGTMQFSGNKLSIAQLEFFAADKISAHFNGEIELNHKLTTQLEFNWSVNTDDYLIEGWGEANGDQQNLIIKHNLVKPYQLIQQVQLTNLLDDLNWTLNSDAEQLDLEQIKQHGVLTKLNLFAEGNLNSASINLEAQLLLADQVEIEAMIKVETNDFNNWKINQALFKTGNTGEVDLSGEIRLNHPEPAFDLMGHWRAISLPSDLSELPIYLDLGEINLTGIITDYQLNLSSTLTINSYPLQATLSANGAKTGFKKLQIQLKSEAGEASYDGNLNWGDCLTLSGELRWRNFNPAVFDEAWPGTLTGGSKLFFSSSLSDEDKVELEVNNLHLSGVLRDRPIKLETNLKSDLSYIQIADFQLASGQSSLTLQGSVTEKFDIAWQLASPDMADFHPDITGKLDAKGQFVGDLARPIIKAEINAEKLGLHPHYRVEKLSAMIETDLNDDGIVAVQSSLTGLKIDATSIPGAELTVTGHTNKHDIRLRLDDDNNSLIAELNGGLINSVWQGKITDLTINQSVAGNWNLKNATELSISAQRSKLGKFCLQNKQSALCTKIDFDQSAGWQTEGQLNKVPVALFHALYPPLSRLNGDIEGEFSLKGINTHPVTGAGTLSLIEGKIELPGDQGQIDLLETKIDYSLTENAVKAKLLITPDIKGVSPLRGQLSSSSVKEILAHPATVNLTGALHFSVDDLAALQNLHYEYTSLRGALNIDLKLTGTAEIPILSGNANLRNGGIYLPRLDIQLENFNINSEGQLGTGLKIDYSVDSGEGQIYGNGIISVDPEAGWLFNGRIKGTQFEIVNLPELWGTISPDLELTINPVSAAIKGTVSIDEAEIIPLKYASQVTTSQDVVVIRATVEPEQQNLSPPVSTLIDVTVQLGDNVRLIADDIEILFAGDLRLITDADNKLLASGVLTMTDGTESLNDRRLKLTSGRIIFSDSALDRPEIDVRVEREQDDVTAGAHILGQLNKTQVTFFSTPIMTDQEIIIHLITGDSSSTATNLLVRLLTGSGGLSGGTGMHNKIGLDTLKLSGTGVDDSAIELGKYLAPGLYVGYGVGLIDQLSTVIIRYKLTDIWSIRAESGEQTGADILFTHER